MIVVVKFVLRAVSGGGLPWFVGHECRAGFVGLVSRFDSDFGLVLHEGVEVGGRRKAVFSLRPLMFDSGYEVVFPGGSSSRFLVDGNVVFEPGARGSMSVVFLVEDLGVRFLHVLLSSAGELRFSVKGYEFVIERVGLEFIDPISIVRSGELLDEIDIEFLTPTYFNPMQGDTKYCGAVPVVLVDALHSLFSYLRRETNSLELHLHDGIYQLSSESVW